MDCLQASHGGTELTAIEQDEINSIRRVRCAAV